MKPPHPDLACQRVVEMVTDYLEGTLELDEHARLEQHLVLCDACVAYIDQHRSLVSALRKLPAPSVEPTEREQARAAALEAFRKARSEDEP